MTPHQELATYLRFEEDELCKDVVEYGAWISRADTDRKPAFFSGFIVSTQELIQMTIAKDSMLVMRAQACQELRRRYLADYAEQIMESAKQAQKELG